MVVRALSVWLARLVLVAAGLCAPMRAAGQAPAPPDTLAPAPAPAATRTADDLLVHRDTIAAFVGAPYRLRPFVQPGTARVYLNGAPMDTSAFTLDARRGRLWIGPRLAPHDTLVAVYRTWDLGLDAVYRRRKLAAADDERLPDRRARAPGDTLAAIPAGGITVVDAGEAAPEDGPSLNPFEGITLERSGSITRGVIGGNARDTNVESGLRLQLQGTLADDVRVRAVLTDQNTPIQPQGTTQRLQEFDRVFVELQTPQGTAQLGDVEVVFEGTTFAPFRRKLQGATVRSERLGELAPGGAAASAEVVGAITRGVFRAQQVQPIDGVQGPYRLQGPEGEPFVLVVPGSERVYLDGQRLTRGATNDYVIDYVRGELSFTPNRIITADRRILIEFEAATTQFNRSFVGARSEVGLWQAEDDGRARLRVGARLLREADGRDFNTAFGVSPQDSLRLVEAGDAGAVQSGAEVVPFDPEAPFVQYRQEVVTLPGGTRDTAFVPLEAAPPDGAPVFRVRFTPVGAGQGRYARGGRLANGIVYEYRGPGQGAYEPVQRLPQPIQRRLVDLTGAVEPLRGVTLHGEWARSLNDQNRLSDRDAFDDVDDAFVAGLRVAPTPVEWGRTSLGTVSAAVQRERRGRYFVTFNRTRAVEFGRRWNVTRPVDPSGSLSTLGDETVDTAEIELAPTPTSRLGLSLGRLELGSAFRGVRRQVTLGLHEDGLPRLDYRLERITSEDRTALASGINGGAGITGDAGALGDDGAIDGRWWRGFGTVRQPMLGGRLTPRLEVEHEHQRQRVVGAVLAEGPFAGRDSLDRASQAFVELRPGLAYEAGDLAAAAEVEYRTEDAWLGGTLRDAATAWTTQVEARYRPGADYDARAKVGYRVRRFTEPFRLEQQREGSEAVLMQWEAGARPWNRAVELRGFYDALTERTPTLQELFVRVGPELGQYVWTDANGDGLLQIDEFVPETLPNEGEYVQTFVPSDSLASVISVDARLRLRLDPARAWRRATGRWKRALALVATETEVEVREQNRTADLASIYLLNLSRFRAPGQTVDGRLSLSQDVYLFRPVRWLGLDLGWQQARALSERAAGTQRRFRNRWRADATVRPSDAWTLALGAEQGTDRLGSDAFADTRSYAIRSRTLEPEVGFAPAAGLRLTVGAVVARKRDRRQPRRADVVRLPVRLEVTRAQRLSLSARAEAADVRLAGDARGLAAFELTDGRGPGRSYLWGVTGQYAFSRTLRATFAYDGRAPEGLAAIHTFRVQMSAAF